MTIWPDSDPISFLFFFLFIQGSKEGVKLNENEAKVKKTEFFLAASLRLSGFIAWQINCE